MSDQATELRRLAREAQTADSEAVRKRGPAPGCGVWSLDAAQRAGCLSPFSDRLSVRGCPRPRLVVVAGGKGGVGTTTIAVNLAAALARQEKRAVLADLSPAGGAVIFCRVAGRGTVADVLAGRRTAAEILEPGPAGIHVLPGQWESGETWSSTASAEEHLIEQLQGLLPIADFVVIDAGNSPTRIARRLWLASDRVLLVTTPELASLRNVFAAAKSLGTGNDAMCVDTVVNMVPTAAAAHDVHSRLALACRRFLGLRLRPAGHVRRATHVEDAGRQATPFVLASPACHASRQMGHLARFVAGT